MKSKADIRKQIEQGMLTFTSNGGQITKVEKKARQPKEKIVEIQVEHLPQSLQTKYFGN